MINNKRQSFALDRAKYWLQKLVECRNSSGNILSSTAAFKYRKAWRVYQHYHRIYCQSIGIPFYNEVKRINYPRIKPKLITTPKISFEYALMTDLGNFHEYETTPK